MKKLKLFVLGDSISIYYGPFLKKLVLEAFEYDRKREPGQTIKDLDKPVGANGEDSGQVLELLQEQHRRGKINYDVLLLNCGLHDIKTDLKTPRRQVDLGNYKKNLEAVLALVKKAGVKTVWVRTTPVADKRHQTECRIFRRFNRDVIRYNQAADELMRRSKIPLIDLYSFTRNLGEDVYKDHVHFTATVSALQAAFIAGSLFGLLSPVR